MIAALIARRKQLGLSNGDLENASGLVGGYTAKLENQAKTLGPVSFGIVIEALGLEVVLVAKTPPAYVREMMPDPIDHARRRLRWLQTEQQNAAGRHGRGPARQNRPRQREPVLRQVEAAE